MSLRTALPPLIAIVILAACNSGQEATSEQAASSALVTQGAEVYAQYCAACHGTSGEGQRSEAPLQKDETGRFPAPPHDETGHTWHHDDDLLIEIIKRGGMGNPDDFYPMPAFGDTLTDQDIAAVLAFIKTMWTDEQRNAQRLRTEAAQESRQ